MAVGTVFVGLVVLAGFIAPATFAARQVQRQLLPTAGSMRVLIVSVIALGLLVLSAEIAGTVGQFNRLGLVMSSTAVAAISVALTPRVLARKARPDWPSVDRDHAAGPAAALPRWAAVACMSAVAAVTGQWIAGVLLSYRWGITQFDSLAYHLPIAAHFGQSGSTTQLLLVGPDPLQAFHTANVELLDGVGMVAFRSDVISPLLSLGWLFLALGGAWCLGRRTGTAPLLSTTVARSRSRCRFSLRPTLVPQVPTSLPAHS